jgi:hypothetical protein
LRGTNTGASHGRARATKDSADGTADNGTDAGTFCDLSATVYLCSIILAVFVVGCILLHVHTKAINYDFVAGAGR